jgi:hypothetical protein
MKNFIACALAALLFLFTGLAQSKAQSLRNSSKTHPAVLPQALPVYNLLKAVETNDFDLYQSVWSSEHLKKYPREFDKQDWQKTRENWVELFRNEGIYNRKRLTFTFEGSDSSGVVNIRRKGLQPVLYNVIKENGKWKLKVIPEVVAPGPISEIKVPRP